MCHAVPSKPVEDEDLRAARDDVDRLYPHLSLGTREVMARQDALARKAGYRPGRR